MRRLVSASLLSASARRRRPALSSVGTMVGPGASEAAARRIHATAQHLEPAVGLASMTTTTHAREPRADKTPYFVDNAFVHSETDAFIDVADPATNKVVARVPHLTDGEMAAAVASAQRAFASWRHTTVLARQQVMFRFVQLIRHNWDRLAASITLEQGKTLTDAKGDVLRGLQVAEATIAAPELLKGELLKVAKDMEKRTYREPLGVVAAICPFSESKATPARVRARVRLGMRQADGAADSPLPVTRKTFPP